MENSTLCPVRFLWGFLFWPSGTTILATYIIILFRIESSSSRYRPVVLDIEYFSMLVESWMPNKNGMVDLDNFTIPDITIRRR